MSHSFISEIQWTGKDNGHHGNLIKSLYSRTTSWSEVLFHFIHLQSIVLLNSTNRSVEFLSDHGLRLENVQHSCNDYFHSFQGFVIPVNIRVTDANDNVPQFVNAPYVLNISEVRSEREYLS